MKTLVAVSSKHGGTEGIGRAIADSLRAAGIEVDEVAPEQVASVDEYDGVVVGSAIYMGRWMGPARDLVRSQADVLRRRPVWLFASGPVTGVEDPADAAEGLKLLALVGGRDFRVFAGRLDRDGLGFAERAVVRMIKSPWGDYRPWESIREWTTSIATAINTVPADAYRAEQPRTPSELPR
jgi:menaquinone-dependent protoporphyrinogen oxidase